jgi:hypothetical protein
MSVSEQDRKKAAEIACDYFADGSACIERLTNAIAAALAAEREAIITPEARTTAENVYQSWLLELQDPETRVKPTDEEWLKTLFALTISRLKVHYALCSIDSSTREAAEAAREKA